MSYERWVSTVKHQGESETGMATLLVDSVLGCPVEQSLCGKFLPIFRNRRSFADGSLFVFLCQVRLVII